MVDKDELETFQTRPKLFQALVFCSLVYHSVFSFTKSYNILKHLDLVAYVTVCNSCEATWFRQP